MGNQKIAESQDPNIVYQDRIRTGVPGLDELLDGGLIPCRRYLVRGAPGQGKTTLGLNFLTGIDKGEKALFIGFQEPEKELRDNALSVGVDVDGIHFLSLSPDEAFFTQSESYDVFAASDVEQEPLADLVVETVEKIKPARVFVDSLTQLRFLAADVYQYRKQALSFLRFLTERGATILFSSESSRSMPDDDLQFLADGVISLEPKGQHSTISVRKFRGSTYSSGLHQYRIETGGIRVFPKLKPPASKIVDVEPIQMKSGNENLDAMLHGGLEAGTVTLVTGPTGIGKSTMAAQFAVEAARAGRKSAVYVFDEELQTFMWRMRSLNINADTHHKAGDMLLEQVEPLRYLADEFTAMVRRQVVEGGVELVVLDSIKGLELAMESIEDVTEPLHAFAKSLARLGVTVILINETDISMDLQVSQRNISYLADNVIFLRYVQPDGALHKVVGVLKKRMSGFQTEARQFEITQGGMRLTEVDEGLERSVSHH